MYPLYGVLIATAIRMLVMLGLGYLVIAFTPDSFPGTIKGIGFLAIAGVGWMVAQTIVERFKIPDDTQSGER